MDPCVIRNMSGVREFYMILMCFLINMCMCWLLLTLILSMHGSTMKFIIYIYFFQIFGKKNLKKNQNSIQEEIKSRSQNASYHSVQNILSSSLLSKNLKIKIRRTKILPVVYGCETWSLILREERKLSV